MVFAVTTVRQAWYKKLIHNISPLSETQTNDKMIQIPRNCNETGSVAYSNTPY